MIKSVDKVRTRELWAVSFPRQGLELYKSGEIEVTDQTTKQACMHSFFYALGYSCDVINYLMFLL